MLEEVDIKVKMKPHRTLRQILVKPKDHEPTNQQTGIVCRIPCKDCAKANIYQPGRTLKCRMKEHRRDAKHSKT